MSAAKKFIDKLQQNIAGVMDFRIMFLARIEEGG
jgi:hypothetical protein